MERGQVSWVWGMLAALLALAVFTGFWIISNETQERMHDQMISGGANAQTLGILESMLKFAPVVVLASLALYAWTTAASTQGY